MMKRIPLTVLAIAALAPAVAANAAPPATVSPGRLTVGVAMPSEGFQTGAVRGDEVVYARGFEIDLAKQLATQLQLGAPRFVQSPFPNLYSAGAKPWDVAIGQISIVATRRKTTDFSIPYMLADEGVLLTRQVTTVPKNIAGLRSLRLCVAASSTGAAIVRTRVKPKTAATAYKDVDTMMQSLQTGRCQAVVYDAPSLATLRKRVPSRYGAFAGRIRTNGTYGIAVPKGSAILPPVNAALRRMTASGAINKLEKKWLAVDIDKLPILK